MRVPSGSAEQARCSLEPGTGSRRPCVWVAPNTLARFFIHCVYVLCPNICISNRMFRTDGLRLAGRALALAYYAYATLAGLFQRFFNHDSQSLALSLLATQLDCLPACLSARQEQPKLRCLLGSIGFWQRFSATLTNCPGHKQSLAVRHD